MTTCPHCTRADAGDIVGRYAFSCLGCCARLVASARPVRHLQEVMLAAIARFPGAPERAQILQAIRSQNHG